MSKVSYNEMRKHKPLIDYTGEDDTDSQSDANRVDKDTE